MAQFIGFAFPFKKGSASFPDVATDNDLIKQALVQLVLTGSGERVMRPDYGSSAYGFVFEPNDDILKQRVETELTVLIGKYEPRVALIGITVQRGNPDLDSEASSVVITIEYVVLATKTMDQVNITLSAGGA